MNRASAVPSAELLEQIPSLAARWRAGEQSAAEFAAHYFLYWQIAIHGHGFAARKHKSDPRPEAKEWLATLAATNPSARKALLRRYLDRYQFRGVITDVTVALCRWLDGSWRLALCEHIPRPIDVLDAQARGTRPVTAITAYPRLRAPVLGKPNGFAFFLHDLAHAYKFFHSPVLHHAQRAFFATLAAAIDRGVFSRYLEDSRFAESFDYLISDMNTHPEHSRQYLRAIMIEFHLRREGKPLTAPLTAASREAAEAALAAVASVALTV